MPYNVLNKKQWLSELDTLSNTYIEFINKLSSNKNETGLDIVMSKKYKSNNLIFTGSEIVEAIQNKLADDINYIYEFKVVDNRPVIKRAHRVLFDDEESKLLQHASKGVDKNVGKTIGYQTAKNENIATTIEELKSKYVESLKRNAELEEEIVKGKKENYELFKELVDAYGGLYHYAVKKKLILMFSKLLKDSNLYKDELGAQYSYEQLNNSTKESLITAFYAKVYYK